MARMSFAYILVVLMFAVAACSGGEQGATTTTSSATNGGTPRATIALITHQAPGDTFWDLVRRGAEAAAAQGNIDLQYASDPDPAGQAKLVRSAISGKVAGIAVTLADPAVMAPAVRTAIAAGIPVVAVNTGIADWKALGVMEYFGQDETIAGQAAGERFTHEGARDVLCVIHQPGHVGLEARCDGLAADRRELRTLASELQSVQQLDAHRGVRREDRTAAGSGIPVAGPADSAAGTLLRNAAQRSWK